MNDDRLDIREYIVNGVRVESYAPAEPTGNPPLLFVHGGCHGSWSWRNFLPFFAGAGWDCHALNWYGHHGSESLPTERFVRRGIADVTEEIAHVAAGFARPPILIGHSMGGLASQKYAELHAVAGLVLITPVVPAEVGGAIIELPVDMAAPWGPPPFPVTLDLFFQGLSPEQAEPFYPLLCPESPRAVFEATRCTVPIDKTRLSGPILVIAGELDILTPPSTGRALADFYNADYRYLRGVGHNMLLEPHWRKCAGLIADWLARSVAY